MSWSYILYIALLFVSALAGSLLAVYGWRRRERGGVIAFVLLALSAAEWSAGYALELLSRSLPAIIFWAKLEYLGIAALPVAWLLFALYYSGREKWLSPRILLALALIPIVTVLLVFSNEAHGLVWSKVSLIDGPGGSLLFTPAYGPWFWIQWVYAYVCLLAGTVFLLLAAGRFSRLYRPQALSLVAGILTPWLGNLLYILDVSPFDLTPLGFTVAALWLGWSVYRFRLLEVAPVAYNQVFAGMLEGVVILDLKNRVVDANPAAAQIIGLPLNQLLGQPVASLPVARRELVERFADVTEAEAEISLGEPPQERHFHLRISPLLNRRGLPAGRLIIVHDISGQVQARERVQRQNAYLAALNETTLALMNRLELEELLEAIVAQAGRLLDTPHGYIHLAEANGEELEARIGLGVLRPLVGFRLRPGEGLAGKVWQTGQPLAIDDYTTWPDRVERVNQPFHAAVGVPLRTASQIAGVIGLVRVEPGRPFEDHEIDLLSRFAQLAAIALDNAWLYKAAQDELAERNRAESRQTVFTGLAQALNALTTPEAAAWVVVNAADELMGWDACALNLYVPKQDRLYHVLSIDTIGGQRHQVPAGNPSDEPSPTARKVISEGPQLILRQIAQSSAEFTTFGDKSRPSASLMFVPIHSGSQVSGILTIQSYTPNAYTPDDLATLQALADHASSALDRIRATDELRAQKQLFESLVTVARALAEQPDLAARLRNALDIATNLTAAQQGDLFLLDETGRVTHNLITGTTSSAETNALARQAMQNGLAGWVARQRQAALIADVEEDPRWLPLPVAGEPPRSALCLPIIGRRAILGVMTLLHPTPGHFTPQQLHLMLAATEQMALSLENARQHSQLMALVESSRDGIALFSGDGRLLVLNPAALAILGLPGEPAVWINRTLPDMLLSNRRAAPRLVRLALAQLHQLVSQPDSSAEGELELPPRVAYWFTLPIHMGEVSFGRLLVLRDVTEDRTLAKLRQDLMQTLVHDLRNPLIAIFGAVEFLIHAGEAAPALQRQMLEIVQQNARRMSDLINTMMDIGRLESQQMPLALESVSLPQVVAETFHLQSPLLSARQLQPESHLPPDLPPAWGDARLIGRILQNLVGNAIKFTADGGLVRVTAQAVESPDAPPHLWVTVQDNGPGIPDEVRPRLFEKFVTGPHTGRGSGLGLAFCRLAVEAQGGRIWVASEAGQGTAVHFTLPVDRAHPTPATNLLVGEGNPIAAAATS